MQKIKICISFILLEVIFNVFFNNLSYADSIKSGWIIFKKAQSVRFRELNTVAPVNGDLSAVFYNPAVSGINNQRRIQLISEYGFAECKFGGLIYSEPLKHGTITCSVMYYDAGEMDLNYIDGQALITENVIAQRDILGLLSYGHKIYDNICIGGTVKIASSEIAEMENAVAYCEDFGLYLPMERLSISIAAQNIGTSTKFIDRKNPLPTSFYSGAGYTFNIGKVKMLSGLGATYNRTDKEIIFDIGYELNIKPISLNIGYPFNVAESNLHIGLRCSCQNIDFGYAYVYGYYVDAIHRFSISYKFKSTK